jgi:hypothetical protein
LPDCEILEISFRHQSSAPRSKAALSLFGDYRQSSAAAAAEISAGVCSFFA